MIGVDPDVWEEVVEHASGGIHHASRELRTDARGVGNAAHSLHLPLVQDLYRLYGLQRRATEHHLSAAFGHRAPLLDLEDEVGTQAKPGEQRQGHSPERVASDVRPAIGNALETDGERPLGQRCELDQALQKVGETPAWRAAVHKPGAPHDLPWLEAQRGPSLIDANLGAIADLVQEPHEGGLIVPETRFLIPRSDVADHYRAAGHGCEAQALPQEVGPLVAEWGTGAHCYRPSKPISSAGHLARAEAA
mmetsp:Transcript_58396/g.126351  ORF Transcript_58396/g.126351 Transcript_58396/m.126351 type:complete len:249 (+) Transcript_58396:547-1293(+)